MRTSSKKIRTVIKPLNCGTRPNRIIETVLVRFDFTVLEILYNNNYDIYFTLVNKLMIINLVKLVRIY